MVVSFFRSTGSGYGAHMMAVASSMYCAAAAPPGLLATLNGAVGSVHYSFGNWVILFRFWVFSPIIWRYLSLIAGRSLGSFIGGILMVNYGTRNTFQIFGTGAGICAIVYLVLHRLYLVKIERLRLRRKSGTQQLLFHIYQG